MDEKNLLLEKKKKKIKKRLHKHRIFKDRFGNQFYVIKYMLHGLKKIIKKYLKNSKKIPFQHVQYNKQPR